MTRVLLILVIAVVAALLVWRWRTGHFRFQVSSWPLGQQIEMTLAVLSGVAALLGAVAGEFDFALWLALVAAIVAALALLSWPRPEP